MSTELPRLFTRGRPPEEFAARPEPLRLLVWWRLLMVFSAVAWTLVGLLLWWELFA